ncbi:PH (Pleckstrin Homology) domain-containing protein [Desulfobotulus alkaliphilus]|uniref:PH (Pleckstrin Homology) domain-containing protein n=1 Tax=Desulfobotulus alkaliphilus TaxID=622671 RepID=A0A562S7D9_9BACT|nr:PH domain-containing protein [Desulfobotulus alkaliphilus]TWI77335.1 PH (Pleckstrin Homology) domain-containing protein [Desulfobotulus alkaliphilus]
MPDLYSEFRPAWRSYWQITTLSTALFFLAVFIVFTFTGQIKSILSGISFTTGLLLLGLTALKRFSLKFTIDEKRISRHKGIIARNQQSIRIQDLKSIELNQSIPQRLLGIGDIAFYSAGSNDAEVRFQGILNPSAWRDKVDEAIDLSIPASSQTALHRN